MRNINREIQRKTERLGSKEKWGEAYIPITMWQCGHTWHFCQVTHRVPYVLENYDFPEKRSGPNKIPINNFFSPFHRPRPTNPFMTFRG